MQHLYLLSLVLLTYLLIDYFLYDIYDNIDYRMKFLVTEVHKIITREKYEKDSY